MTIPALSLTQPWASLVTWGEKQFETRSWKTDYRGPLVIHASKSFVARADADYFDTQPAFKGAAFRHGLHSWRELPLGTGLCLVELVDVVRVERVRDALSARELAFGNYSDGRFAWKLANVQPFPEPIPASGRLQLWPWTLPLPEGIRL